MNRPSTRTLRTLSLLAALALWSCYNPNIPDGQQQCTADDKCPEGFTCVVATHTCYRNGVMPACTPSCAAPTPLCDLTQLKCVSCLKDADCGPGELCVNKSCKAGCSAQKPTCGDDAGSCDVDLGVCRGCLNDSECSGATPRCDTTTERCVPCLTKNDNCPSDQYCKQSGSSYTCEPGCKDRNACLAGSGGDGGTADGGSGGSLECCDHKCVDVAADTAHCGACGMTCGGSANTCCGGACADTMADVAHCGGCGKLCNPANVVTASCTAGACGYTTCKTGFADCNMNPADGCEVNILTSTANCGKCGMACPGGANAMAACNAGTCALNCATGFANCDMNNANGCESPVASDVNNCGSCGKVCSAANGTPSCVASTCQIASCTAPFRNCDNNVSNGCEINSSNNVSHCGACGNACGAVVNGTPACVGSACTIGACNANFGNCDNNTSNGCEANFLTNLSHCGGCNRPCSLANATATCSGGVCAVASCTGVFANCNGNATDGCEVNTTNNVLHCGGCNKPCAGGQSCINGLCATGTGNGTVRDVNGTIFAVSFVPCGNGTVTNCTQAVAEASCSGIGKRLVSHASDGTGNVTSLGATSSCFFSISYFTNNLQAAAGQCLVGVSNANWSMCCGLNNWHGNTVAIPTTLGQQFGYAHTMTTGYNANLANVTGATWGCQGSAMPPMAFGGCGAYYVACR